MFIGFGVQMGIEFGGGFRGQAFLFISERPEVST